MVFPGVDVGEQFLGQLVSNDANAGAVAVFRVGEETAAFDDEVADVDHTGRLSVQLDVGQLLILVPYGHPARRVRADVGAEGAAGLEALDVVHADIGGSDGSPVLISAGGGEGHFPDAKDIRAEVRDFVLDVGVRPEDERNDHDQDGDAHRQAEHREHGAQPMVDHRVEGQSQVGA